MRLWILVVALLLLTAPALAFHNEGKGARSLGGKTVARTDTMLALESNEFPLKPVGVAETDGRATGGSAWNLTTYGLITTEFDMPSAGVVWIDIRARGWHPSDMMNPHMHILIDGEQRAEWDVRGDWLAYPQSIPILAGRHTLSVDNFNNYRADVANRALVVDWVQVSAPTLEGSPRVPIGGSVVVDAAEIHNSVTGQLEQTTEARGGTQWIQWGVGCFAQMAVFEGSGPHTLTSRLRGNVWNGVGSHVVVKYDTVTIDEYHAGEAWKDHVSSFDATKGPHLLEICYDNDEAGKKRNLWLDELTITSAGGSATPPPPAGSEGWPAAHATLDNHRHVASGINVQSIRTAEKAWSYRAGPVTGTPAVLNGTAYFGDMLGKLHALRVSDGSVVWSVDNGAGVDSSVAVDAKNVYIGDQKGWLSARARSDGSLVWRVRADDIEGTHLYGSPVLHDGVLYTGVASEQTLVEYEGEQTFRGSVAAFDSKDGKMLWKTYTQGEEGAGVSVWSTPAIDPELGLLFVGSGNSYGEPVSPYTDSILAMRLADGAIAWSFQGTTGDAFNARGSAGPDRDFGASPILFEAAGKKLVGDGDKGGTFYALERATGALVWSAKADFKVEGVPPSRVEGFLGTASYHDGTIYAPTTARSMVNAIDAATGTIQWATELNPLPTKYGDRMFAPSTAADGVILQGNAFGKVFALDAATGTVIAEFAAGGAVQGGIALAGDTFLVGDVGPDLWSGQGGLTAFRVDVASPPKPTPTPPVVTSPIPDTPITTPQGTTPNMPSESVDPEGNIRDGVPGAPFWALLIAFAASAAWAARAKRS